MLTTKQALVLLGLSPKTALTRLVLTTKQALVLLGLLMRRRMGMPTKTMPTKTMPTKTTLKLLH